MTAKSVPILNISQTKLRIEVPKINEVLKKVGDHPFVFISINGQMRSGKSFTLSCILQYLRRDKTNATWLKISVDENAFEWRGGTKRHTNGINVWSEPFWTNHERKKTAILLMDTQGSFDDQTTIQQNALIFAISSLLSSVMIFNIKNQITEDILQNFEFFSSYATLAASDCGNSDAVEKRSGVAFQKLIFLNRDFESIDEYKFGYYDDATTPTGQKLNYKKEIINSKPDQPLEVRFTHDQVTSSFKDIGVYLMPEPGRGLRREDRVDKLEPDFQEHVVKFVELIFTKQITTKKIGEDEITGTEMIKFVGAWAKLFEGNGLPEVKNIYTTAAESQYIMARKAANDYYSKNMKDYLRDNPNGVSEVTLDDKHWQLYSEGWKLYHGRRKLGGKEYDARFDEEFISDVYGLLEAFKKTNDEHLRVTKVKKECDEKIRRLSQQMENQKEITRTMEKQHQKEAFTMQQESLNAQSDFESMVLQQKAEHFSFMKELEQKEMDIQRLKSEAEEEKEKELELLKHQKMLQEAEADRQSPMIYDVLNVALGFGFALVNPAIGIPTLCLQSIKLGTRLGSSL